MADLPISRKLWEPPNKEATALSKLKTSLKKQYGVSLPEYDDLYTFSTTRISDFWTHLFQHFPLVYSGTIPSPCVDESASIEDNPRWFKGVNINFAENVLFTGSKDGTPTTSPGKEDSKIAVTQVREGSFQEPIVDLSWSELRERVGRLSNALRARGVKKGDRVALVASTSIDTLTTFLATVTVGALFSSSSTDMGTKGILDRLLQIRPRYVFFDDMAVYNGKTVDLRSKIKEVIEGMQGVTEFQGVVAQTRFPGKSADISSLQQCETWESFLKSSTSSKLTFEKTAFSDPFIIVYSSGTTGAPKCIVHSHGGVVLNGHKEGNLHRDIDRTSTQLQYTTTGWIMYLASVQALLMGARMVAYDGSPFLPNSKTFLELLAQQKVTHFGTSPRWLGAIRDAGLKPREDVDLSSLRVVTCTGMVLSDAIFEWFYDVGFPKIVQLDNISGGTDLAGAFGTGNPILPVYTGGCQSRSLGYAVEVYDSTIESPDGSVIQGQRVSNPGDPGDLVCTRPFPTMPLYFFGDHDNSIYMKSYFGKYKSVWTHGDFIQILPKTGQVVFLGRADGVLNPSGVRFGSSEIYSVIEKYFGNEISDSICVGQRRPQDEDERVVLFVLMKEGQKFGVGLIKRIKEAVARECSKRHVPWFVFETKAIPTTVNLKKVELPVKQIVSGKKVKASGTLGNPESLNYYYQFAEDKNLVQFEKQDRARL